VIFAVVLISLLMYQLDTRHFFVVTAYLVVFLIIIFHLSQAIARLPLFSIPFIILVVVATTTRWRIMKDTSWILGEYSEDRFKTFYYVAIAGLMVFTIPGHPLSYSKVVCLVNRLFRFRLYNAFYFEGEDCNLSAAAPQGLDDEHEGGMAGASTVAGRGPYGASASGPSSFQPVFLSQTVAHNYRNPEDQDHNPHNFKLDEDKREYFSFVFSQVAAGSYRTGYLPLTAVQNMDKIKGGICYPSTQVTASYAMTASAAALAIHSGDYDQQGLSSFILTLFNIGLGDWFEFHHLSSQGQKGYTLCILIHLSVLMLLLFAQIFDLSTMLYVGYSIMLALLLSVFTKLGAVSLYSFPVRQVHQSLGAVWENPKPPPLLYLSDGGHIENLGLVELLRRCNETILVVDAMAADPKYHPFCQLLAAMDRARQGIRSSIQDVDPDLAPETERRTTDVIRCSFRPPSEIDDVIDVEQWLEANLDAPYIKIGVSYHTEEGWLLREGMIHYVRLQGAEGLRKRENHSYHNYPGICCECCHDQPWTRMFGEFPNHGTASQFFTPTLFEVYAEMSSNEVMKEAVEAIREDLGLNAKGEF